MYMLRTWTRRPTALLLKGRKSSSLQPTTFMATAPPPFGIPLAMYGVWPAAWKRCHLKSPASVLKPCSSSPLAHAASKPVMSATGSLQALLKAESLDAYLVPSADEHLNEYLPDNRQRRAWLTG